MRLALVAALLAGCATTAHDVVIRGGTIYDGSGGPPRVGDVAIDGDRLVAVRGRGRVEIDARGLAVAPGFINMLSWAAEDLVEDGRSLGDLSQGVTLEVFGEGWSMAPRNDRMKAEAAKDPDDVAGRMSFTTLGELLDEIAGRGVSPNIASFVGATTLRQNVLGEDDVDPTPEQLAEMERLADQAMREGALGVGTSLIYAPAAFAETPELVALARVAARHGGMYISHIRDEGDRLLEAVDELIAIARESGARAEIYHLKATKPVNWPKIDEVIRRVEAARAAGLAITADMYVYVASSTSLGSIVAPWAQAGGAEAMRARLRDPATRARIAAEIAAANGAVGQGGDGVLLLNFKKPELRPLIGQRLSAVARARGKGAIDTALDLLVEDGSGVGVAFFSMSEDNVRKIIQLPWVSFGSDGGSTAPEGKALETSTHPRAYGNFARVLGHYVRDEKLVPLEEAIRRLTTQPATNLRLDRRGALRPGFFADVVVFDPKTIRDVATFDNPHQLATGVRDVFVNGVAVLRDGKHTGAKPGRVVRGPGWRPR